MSTTLGRPKARPGFSRRVVAAVATHPVVSVATALVLGLVVWLVFFVFAFHLVFIDDEVNEAEPFATASPSATSLGATTPANVAAAAKETHRGSFVDRSHPTSGVASVVTDGSKTFLRFEDLRTDNGPDLFVYLSAGISATSAADQLDDDYVDLGKLKGNIGSQNYELPAGTDLAKYRTVVIWCRRFSTAFGASDLTPSAARG